MYIPTDSPEWQEYLKRFSAPAPVAAPSAPSVAETIQTAPASTPATSSTGVLNWDSPSTPVADSTSAPAPGGDSLGITAESVSFSYADLLTSTDYRTEDIGQGKYNIYGQDDVLLGIGYKGVEDATKEYTRPYYEKYISYADPTQGIWTQPGTSGGNDQGDWTTPGTSLTVDQFKKAYGHAPTDPYYSSGVTWGEGLGFIAPKTGYSLDAPWFGSGARIEYGGNAGGWGNTLQGSAATRGSDPFMTYTPGGGGGDNQSVTEGYYTPTMFKDRASLDAAMDTWLLSPEYRDFYGNMQDTGALQDWELLGQAMEGAPYLKGATSWRDFGGDQKKQTIAGANTLYGSEAVFKDGKLAGNIIDLSPGKKGDYAAYEDGDYLRIKDAHGATTSDAFIGRNLLGDKAAWNAVGTSMGDGKWFIPVENADKIPGWENVESYGYHQEEKKKGLGAIGGVIGAAMMFIPGMQPWAAGMIGGALSSGTIKGAITGGVMGYLGGEISGLVGNPIEPSGTLFFDDWGVGSNVATHTAGEAIANSAIRSGVTSAIKGGISVAADGGSFSDILEGAAISGATGAVSSGAGGVAGDVTDSSTVGALVRWGTSAAINNARQESGDDSTPAASASTTAPGSPADAPGRSTASVHWGDSGGGSFASFINLRDEPWGQRLSHGRA